MPETITRALEATMRGLLRLIFRIEVHGLHHFDAAGQRVLIVANHTSLLDAVLLALFLPGRQTFAIHTRWAEKWWMRPLLAFVNTFAIDPSRPLSTRELIRYMREDHRAVVFPEGRITVTGGLMKVYHGPAMVADKAEAELLPVRIDGPQYSLFSYLRGRLRRRLFPKITLTLLAPRRLQVPEGLKARRRREYAGQQLRELMTEMMFVTTPIDRTLPQALREARRAHGGSRTIAEDIQREPLSYNDLLTRICILGPLLARGTEPGERVGVMLPNSTANLVVFFALLQHGRVPAMLNFTQGRSGLLSALRTAEIRQIFTSRRFIEQGKLEAEAEQLAGAATVTNLEDLRPQVRWHHKLLGWLRARLPPLACADADTRPDAPAAVLFTSGTEGRPKGVVLSHCNLLANWAQISARVSFNHQDTLLNALPMFHSFGLTAGTLLPVLSGVRLFLYPTPLHYRIIPEVAYDRDATALLGTNTFLNAYARHANPYDFYNMRFVVAGAEKLQEGVRQAWQDRFGVRIYEGYGATETAPVLSVNTPTDYRPGSVGRLLPGIDYYLQPVEGIDAGGRLVVRGPNVMLGYLRYETPGELQPPETDRGPGWYDTGDIIEIDDEGFLWIRGRAKRFAKIGGEMVSLAAVEKAVSAQWPEEEHVVATLSDGRKGEQLVLLSTAPLDREAVRDGLRQQGVGELYIPRQVFTVREIPLLVSGKVHHAAVEALARCLLDGGEERECREE